MENKNPLARPWYEWIGWLIWLAALILFLQSALASRIELEPRAALISWIIVIVLLVFAAIVWGMRLARKG
jgi:preprotein translocase subunit Sec61beta